MYHYIKGKYITRGDSFAVIDNNGIGYKIYTSETALEQLSKTISDTILYTYLNVREDAMDLYGFPTNEEIGMFLNLLSVSGVGPKAALAIMSVATPEAFARAVILGDIKAITKASGVGPKLAQRIILELKDKLKTTDAIDLASKEDEVSSDAQDEAVSALVVLGYSAFEARRAVKMATGTTSEELIKDALKHLI